MAVLSPRVGLTWSKTPGSLAKTTEVA